MAPPLTCPGCQAQIIRPTKKPAEVFACPRCHGRFKISKSYFSRLIWVTLFLTVAVVFAVHRVFDWAFLAGVTVGFYPIAILVAMIARRVLSPTLEMVGGLADFRQEPPDD
jgi:hypothetical protein